MKDIKIHCEILMVKELGELIGYGNLMCMASALWREDMLKRGYPISGVFVPVLPFDVQIEDYDDRQEHYEDLKHYDNLIKENK
jgi:hypothetical protein